MTQIDTESDPLLKTLTEALRAGPGTPLWHDAVNQLRASGVKEADEYQLLMTAREHLASGKDYREVRAGAGFTRKLFSGLDSEPNTKAGSPQVPVATIIAVLAAIGLIAVVIVVAMQLAPHGDQTQVVVDELVNAYYGTELMSATFDRTESPVPTGWRPIGALPLATAGGLHIAPDGAQGTTLPTTAPSTVPTTVGGGIVTINPLSPDQAFSIEADLKLPRAGEGVVTQVFVSSSPDFSPDRATSPHELVWNVRGKDQQVFVDGNAVGPGQALPAGEVKLRIVVSRDVAVVESGAKNRVWAGTHHLAADQQRYVGVRFIRTSADAKEAPTVLSLHVLRK